MKQTKGKPHSGDRGPRTYIQNIQRTQKLLKLKMVNAAAVEMDKNVNASFTEKDTDG